jgi:hypothetical protein
MFRSDKKRRSVNLKDIHGLGVTSAVGSSAGGGGAAQSGRTLLAEYALTANQSINLAPGVYTYALLNMATAVFSSTLVTGTAPFTLTSDDEYTFWVEAECTFTPSVNAGRYVLAVRNGTATSRGDGAYTFRTVVRGTSRQAFVQGVIDMLTADVLQIELRAFNSNNAAETLIVTAAKVWVYVV